eukprot:TRINITY_DN16962_c0_g1_i1.p1 TRINITY_DN16962_c0_g1~~TRINITY_DN16962_c0_g1_i1.p1  ORF type:complete len:174 (-),score=48.38 TRINITY_DN16962_c0_g1_i1:76-597(-)
MYTFAAKTGRLSSSVAGLQVRNKGFSFILHHRGVEVKEGHRAPTLRQLLTHYKNLASPPAPIKVKNSRRKRTVLGKGNYVDTFPLPGLAQYQLDLERKYNAGDYASDTLKAESEAVRARLAEYEEKNKKLRQAAAEKTQRRLESRFQRKVSRTSKRGEDEEAETDGKEYNEEE